MKVLGVVSLEEGGLLAGVAASPVEEINARFLSLDGDYYALIVGVSPYPWLPRDSAIIAERIPPEAGQPSILSLKDGSQRLVLFQAEYAETYTFQTYEGRPLVLRKHDVEAVDRVDGYKASWKS